MRSLSFISKHDYAHAIIEDSEEAIYSFTSRYSLLLDTLIRIRDSSQIEIKRRPVMTNRGKQYIFFLLTLVIIVGCCKQTPPLLNNSNSSEDSLSSSFLRDQVPAGVPLPPFSTPVTLEELRLAHYTYSLPAIVKKLMENDKANWRMILKKVADGDAEWILYVGIYLWVGMDASSEEELNVAFAHALQSNPNAVMGIDGTARKSISAICSWPFPNPEYSFVLSYRKKTLAALRTVNAPYYLEKRDMCIRRLEHGFKHLKKEHHDERLH